MAKKKKHYKHIAPRLLNPYLIVQLLIGGIVDGLRAHKLYIGPDRTISRKKFMRIVRGADRAYIRMICKLNK
jgi:hypothetical protein